MKKSSYIVSIIALGLGTFIQIEPSIAINISSISIANRDVQSVLVAAEDNLYFGESYYADRQEYHSAIKRKILAAAGAYEKKVGKNPDTQVVKKKIVLVGTGDFKGKSFPTELAAGDYFLKK